jgi:hypothetical protein
MSKSRRKAKVFLKIAGIGCFGTFLACLVVFVVTYECTGHYMPVISNQPPLPVPNAIDDYKAAASQLRANGGIQLLYDENYHLVPSAEPAVVKANQGAIARFRQGLTKECRVPFSPEFQPLSSAYQNRDVFLNNIFSLTRLLGAEGDMYARKGMFQRAVQCGLDEIQFGMDIQRGGSFEEVTHGLWAEQIGQELVAHSHEKLDLHDCDQVMGRLQKLLCSRVSYPEILRQNRDWNLSLVSTIKSSQYDWDAGMLDSQPPRWDTEIAAMEWHFKRDNILRKLEDGYRRVIAEAGKPAAKRNPVPDELKNEGRFGVMANGAWFDRTELRNRLLLCAVALRRYRLTHGGYPATLKELELNSPLTTDPYSGSPIIYRPVGKDYLLYGIGEDGKDDGGLPANESDRPPVGDLGLFQFTYSAQRGTDQPTTYRRVPHMLTPVLPKGAPPFNP